MTTKRKLGAEGEGPAKDRPLMPGLAFSGASDHALGGTITEPGTPWSA